MLSLILAIVFAAADAKCNGSTDCQVCKECAHCEHCKGDGHCGACRPSGGFEFIANNTCLRVIDGDTIVVLHDGKRTTIRLIGVNTPELHDIRKEWRDVANKAAEHVKHLAYGRVVTLEFDGAGKLDKYGRILAYVYVDGVSINEDLIRQGYSKVYTRFKFDAEKRKLFRGVERDAKNRRLGIWADGFGR